MLHRLLRSQRPVATRDEVAFASHALPFFEQAERHYDEWRAHLELTSDYHALANVAAICRWQLAKIARSLADAPPPPALGREAQDGAGALLLAAEAFQQLSHGYRSSKFERVCDGAAQLESARERWSRVRTRLLSCAGDMADSRPSLKPQP